jgi:glycosyltransferase involved in cell wall biosynthesis
MKVCIVSMHLAGYFDPQRRVACAGAEVQAAFVARALREQGVDVRLVVGDVPPGVQFPYPAESAFRSTDGAPVIRFFHPRMTGIMNALTKADADIYYQRNAGMVTGLTAHFARSHGRTFVYGAGSDTDFSLHRVLIEGMRDRVIYMYGLRRAHGVVVQNHAQMAMAKETLSSPVTTIPNGVLPAAQAGANPNGPVVWAGALRAVKRPEMFIELARRFPSREFVMAGGAISTAPGYAERAVREAQSVPNLRLTGWLSHADVEQEIARAAAVVNTSTVEGFPNVYLEAWNHGVPVVSFNDVDGLLANERLGALCTDLDDMEKKLRALLEDPAATREAGERARHAVAQRFSPAVLGPRYLQFFESLKPTRGDAAG